MMKNLSSEDVIIYIIKPAQVDNITQSSVFFQTFIYAAKFAQSIFSQSIYIFSYNNLA